MGYFKIFAPLLVGGYLFAYVLMSTDPAEVLAKAVEVGVTGVLVLLALYLSAFILDTVTWHLTMTTLPVTVSWLCRSWIVRMVGEACNVVLPAGGMGGEPVKAILMKNHHGLDYHVGIASLILTRTINLISLVLFLSIGFGFALMQSSLPTVLAMTIGGSIVAFTAVISAFFAMQRFQVASRISRWLSQTVIGYNISGILRDVEGIDQRLVDFYIQWRLRFLGALALAFGNWFLGACNIYYMAHLLSVHIKLTDAWIIEALVQIVRVGTFFIPASVGVQEGIFIFAFVGFGVSAPVAMAIAILRRGQEILWIMLGGAIGLSYFPYQLVRN